MNGEGFFQTFSCEIKIRRTPKFEIGHLAIFFVILKQGLLTVFAHVEGLHHDLMKEEYHSTTRIPDWDGTSCFGAVPMVYKTFYHLNLSQNKKGIGHSWLLNDVTVNCTITPGPLRMEQYEQK